MPAAPTTGITDLDHVLRTLLPGDNLVWQIDSLADYQPFVEPCCQAAKETGKQVIYIRFAEHPPLLEEQSGVEIYYLNPWDGFEKFIREIHKVIDEVRNRGVYIFDCLSDLTVDWYSDRMLGNFFRLICPYVYDVEGLAYFAMLRNYHSFNACSTIAETTQILIDVFHFKNKIYLHPVKVQRRQSPTMYMPHVWEDDSIHPITDSTTIAEILASKPYMGSLAVRSRPGVWDRTFLQAEQILELEKKGELPPERAKDLVRRLLRMLVTRNEQMLEMAENYFGLEDLIRIWQRTIGTGLIGGKSTGVLLARAILKQKNPRWKQLLEEHDSFFIGSDVFYTYLVQNGCWWLRQKQQNPETFLEGAEDARRRILTGHFTKGVRRNFADMLDHFGQFPIIVRSSSLLEDAFGNSFAGKYQSVFCVNQGSREERLEELMDAVKSIYASTMSEQALKYRSRRGLLEQDEQMSLLIQRVSGSMYEDLYYPQAAGVGLSYNPYVWDEEIDPKAGVLRLVFGLGTRAVERTDDDYTRVVALNVPQKRPQADPEQIRRYTQRKVDLLDTSINQLLSIDFPDAAARSKGLPLHIFASPDEEVNRLMAETGKSSKPAYILTFDKLLSDTPFVEDMRDMLQLLEEAYGCPVDTEFTVNFLRDHNYKINLVQCRPLQVKTATGQAVEAPAAIQEEDLVFKAHGAVVGQSRNKRVDRLIYINPTKYGNLPINDRYAIARLIGRLMHHESMSDSQHIMLLGPGRWGTTMPSLGIPVSYAEINKVSFLCEIVTMHEGLVPDVSLGTHFFNELVETDILYLALFPNHEGNKLNENFFKSMPNRLEQLLPEAAKRSDIVQVLMAEDVPDGRGIQINANNVTQEVVCYHP